MKWVRYAEFYHLVKVEKTHQLLETELRKDESGIRDGNKVVWYQIAPIDKSN